LEIGNSSTVASLAVLLPVTFAFDFSRANLKDGSSLPERSGSGTLFVKLGSPPSTRPVPARAAVVAAAMAAAPVRKSLRWRGDIWISLFENVLGTHQRSAARPR
jgi:hypothetical protein